jgi:hypothetical protein
VFTRALHWSLSWARSIQPMPFHPISLRTILILCTHLCFGFPSCLFHSFSPTKVDLHSLSPQSRYMHCPCHPPWLDQSNYTWRIVQVMKLLILQFSHTSSYSSFFVPNILLSTLFSNSLSVCSSLNVRDQIWHPYKTTGKIIVLYILTFTFLDSSVYVCARAQWALIFQQKDR